MATELSKAAELNGGIIFDFGGFNHSSNVQRLLLKNEGFMKRHQVRFFYAYSNTDQKHTPANIRLMRFQGGNEDQYPLGLEFLTLDYPKQQDTLTPHIDARIEVKNLFLKNLMKC